MSVGGEPREIVEAVGAGDDVDRDRLLDRLAGVEGFEPRQLLVAAAQEIGGALQDAAALGARHRAPDGLAGLRRRDGVVDLRLAGDLDLGEGLAGGRVEAGEGPAGGGADGAAADLVEHPRRRRRGARHFRGGWLEGPRPLELRIREGARHGAGGLVVEFAVLGEGRPEPEPVDHRRDQKRGPLRVPGRHRLLQGVPQVREHAPLVDVLDALEAGRMQHLAPEGEPDARRAPVELLRREVGVDDRLDATARRPRRRKPRRRRPPEPRRHRPQGRLEQTLLVAEIVRDEPWRDAGAPGDVAERAGGKAHVGEGIDRRLDQLPAPDLLRCRPARRPLRPMAVTSV